MCRRQGIDNQQDNEIKRLEMVLSIAFNYLNNSAIIVYLARQGRDDFKPGIRDVLVLPNRRSNDVYLLETAITRIKNRTENKRG